MDSTGPEPVGDGGRRQRTVADFGDRVLVTGGVLRDAADAVSDRPVARTGDDSSLLRQREAAVGSWVGDSPEPACTRRSAENPRTAKAVKDAAAGVEAYIINESARGVDARETAWSRGW
ncbi:MAG: hypothetical protein ABEH90_10625 [Halolamina sp.]